VPQWDSRPVRVVVTELTGDYGSTKTLRPNGLGSQWPDVDCGANAAPASDSKCVVVDRHQRRAATPSARIVAVRTPTDPNDTDSPDA
jgi:hypothetical protein